MDSSANLSMSDGLQMLHDEVLEEVEKRSAVLRKRNLREWFSVFHHLSVRSLYQWTACLQACVAAILLLVAYGFSDQREKSDNIWLVIEACLLFGSVVMNVALTVITASQERMEFARLLKEVLKKMSTCMRYNTWNQSYFSKPEAPASPCCPLQWTIRDNQVVNLPSILLVRGDVILMRPGHHAPALCQQIQSLKDGIEEPLVLKHTEVFSPEHERQREGCHPQKREPLQPQQFVLLETPYLNCVRKILEDSDRPASMLEHERYYVLSRWLERRIMPVALLLSIVGNVVRYINIKGHTGHWTEVLLTLQVHAVVPLLPLLLPVMWTLLNYYGQARILSAFEAARGSSSLGDDSFDTDSSISVDEARVDLPWRLVLDWFKYIVCGRTQVVTRKINILHVLGSVTTLCCVDKKGILSYPNPTPEKIFFLHRGQKDLKKASSAQSSASPSRQNSSVDLEKYKQKYPDTVVGKASCVEVLDVTSDIKKSFGLHFDDPGWKHHLDSLKPLGLAILANTCNLATAKWYTQFSDHVACAALENKDTVAVVNRSHTNIPRAGHIQRFPCRTFSTRYKAKFHERNIHDETIKTTVCVNCGKKFSTRTNLIYHQRCLCHVAKEMGFSEQAIELFSLEKILGMYRQVSAEMTLKEQEQRTKSSMHHKIPMPNVVSVIVREKMSGSCQLLSQGTGDLILSLCNDFWDGEDLSPLSELERKKISDFYHRTSIGSYCTAFSYRPVRPSMAKSTTDLYMELPDDSHQSHVLGQRLSTSSVDVDLELMCDSGISEAPRSFSADSLFDASSFGSEDDGMTQLHNQCNQVFIGMITLQYQARTDFIQLIDKLEGACIRFVHFSQENELRSRVFAEKMGLEAGWNCHISLSPELRTLNMSGMSTNNVGEEPNDSAQKLDLCHPSADKYTKNSSVRLSIKGPNGAMNPSLSRSAPSVVNLESTQVKFEKKVKTAIVSPRKMTRERSGGGISGNDDELSPLHQDSDSDDDYAGVTIEIDGEVMEELNKDSDGVLSRQASSYITENTEDSFTGPLDNRAKLPKGIENIRPHLRSIDNVPLQVNLFTDCTPCTTKEMMSIMQEYGEVVLCVGSSANMQNIPLFLQADCSFALEPMCPQVCLQNMSHQLFWDKDVPTPIQLASSLLSVTCPILISKHDNISLIHLIAEARCHVMSMQNCFYFILCCCLSVCLAQVLASLLQLPPVLGAQHLLWLVLIVIPMLGTTLMGNHVDARVMSLATRKNTNHITTEMLLRFMAYNLVRFVPPVLVALLCYSLTLHSFCHAHRVPANQTCAIFDFVFSSSSPEETWYKKFSGGIIIAQNIFLFLLVLYFEIISLSFVHWSDHLWQQFPATNKLWLTVTPVLICLQGVFCVCDTYVRNSAVSQGLSLSDLHPAIWAVGLAFPVVMVVVNELVKHREIKVAVRYQKRARLDFGTKLGMNSPF